jgi:hypothetical protein
MKSMQPDKVIKHSIYPIFTIEDKMVAFAISLEFQATD